MIRNINFCLYFLPDTTGRSDRSKTPPDNTVAAITKPHCNQLYCIVQRKATGT